MSAPPLIEVAGLCKDFPVRRGVFGRATGRVRAVDDVSFMIGRNEVLGLAGESGSGKSTIGRLLLRLIEPSSGRVAFEGRDVGAMSAGELKAFRRRAQIVFQDPFGSLDPLMTVGESVAEPLRIQGIVARSELADRVAGLLDAVALPADYARRAPDALSGGQRQRVVIARALAVDPSFIVADEPVSALDVSIQAQILALLENLKARRALSLLFISHDIAVMEYVSDRIAVLYLGRLMEIGPSADVVDSPRHPYTEALVSAVPGQRARGRIALTGDMPSAIDPPSGCVFRTRCPYALDACAHTVPALREVAPGHFKACLRDDRP
jgi:oligopeptide/dipeptide ABC transporter ATP-binding protein